MVIHIAFSFPGLLQQRVTAVPHANKPWLSLTCSAASELIQSPDLCPCLHSSHCALLRAPAFPPSTELSEFPKLYLKYGEILLCYFSGPNTQLPWASFKLFILFTVAKIFIWFPDITYIF